jgi:hypothetical protein
MAFSSGARMLRGDDLISRSPICHLVSSGSAARLLCCTVLKKGAGIALTRLATLRHNQTVREYVHCEKVLAQPMASE